MGLRIHRHYGRGRITKPRCPPALPVSERVWNRRDKMTGHLNYFKITFVLLSPLTKTAPSLSKKVPLKKRVRKTPLKKSHNLITNCGHARS